MQPATMHAAVSMDPAVAVGGVGGSGTRLIATLLQELGVRIGEECHTRARDALWFSLLFKRVEILDADDATFDRMTRALVQALAGGQPLSAQAEAEVRALADAPRMHHDPGQLAQIADTLVDAAARPPHGGAWGWKEPNTHVVIERLVPRLPRLRYLHVVRNGLDMAFSGNQRQRDLWGPSVFGRRVEKTPRDSLAYWCDVHRRVAAFGESMGDRFLWLDYDGLCRDPDTGLAALADFLRVPRARMLALRPLVAVQETAGRGRGMPLDAFAEADLDYLRRLGHLD